jgi:hypothetical protein
VISEAFNTSRGGGARRSRDSVGTKKSNNLAIHRTYYNPPTKTVALEPRGIAAFPVNGESFYPQNFAEVQRSLFAEQEIFANAVLIADSTNPADRNAVAVTVAGYVLGHIPATVAGEVSDFLGDRGGLCKARIYFDLDGGFSSVELDMHFPPVALGTGISKDSKPPVLGADIPIYDQGDLTTHRFKLSRLKVEAGTSHFGIAYLHDGFRDSPSVQDEETAEYIARPLEKISYSFNLFARAYGGSARVRYELVMGEDGKYEVWLDSTGLPEFHKKKYY